MTGTEIEFKFKVADEEALDGFARALGMDRRQLGAKLQRNTFFDSRDRRLRERGLALRLRVEDGQGTLTIKGKGVARSGDGALHQRFEAEQPLAATELESLLAGSRSPLACFEASADEHVARGRSMIEDALGGADLECLGSFENERTTLDEVELDCGGRLERIVFELDRTSFPHGRVDCEIEAEIGPECDARRVGERITRLLADAGIEWTSAPSKLQRFVEILEQRR